MSGRIVVEGIGRVSGTPPNYPAPGDGIRSGSATIVYAPTAP